MAAQPKITKFFSTRATNGSLSPKRGADQQPLRDVHSFASDANKAANENDENDSLEYIQVDVDPADIICEHSVDEPTSLGSVDEQVDVTPTDTAQAGDDECQSSPQLLVHVTKKTPSRVVLSTSSKKRRNTKALAKFRSPEKKTPSRRRKQAPLSEPPSPSSSQSSDVVVEDGIIGMKVRSPTNGLTAFQRKA